MFVHASRKIQDRDLQGDLRQTFLHDVLEGVIEHVMRCETEQEFKTVLRRLLDRAVQTFREE